MNSVVRHLLQCLDRDLSCAAMDTCNQAELLQLHYLLYHWADLAEARIRHQPDPSARLTAPFVEAGPG